MEKNMIINDNNEENKSLWNLHENLRSAKQFSHPHLEILICWILSADGPLSLSLHFPENSLMNWILSNHEKFETRGI